MKSKFTIIVLVLLLLLLKTQTVTSQTATCPSWGPYIEGKNIPNMSNNAEVMYSEIMTDAGCMQYNSYWSTLNFSLGPRGGYGGIQYKPGAIKNNIFSLWDLQDTTVPQCTTEYVAPGTFVDGFGGEGTGLHSDNPMPWTPGVWYATVIRRWTVSSDTNTRIAFFMYDYGTQKWTHYITMVTPERNAYLQGNKIGGFLENFSGGPVTRCGYYRNFWMMNSSSQWGKPDTYVGSAGTGSWNVEPAFTNTAIKLTSCGTTSAPTTTSFVLNQAGQKPSIISDAQITGASANITNNQVVVNWTMNVSTNPQLSYTINIYSDSLHTGSPTVSKINTRPEKRSDVLLLPQPAANKYYATIQVKDIFNQQSNIYSFTATASSINTNAWYKIKNVFSSKYLAIKDSSINDLAKIVQYASGTSQTEQWQFVPIGNAYKIVNRKSNKTIDLSGSNQNQGTNPIQYTISGSLNQQWNLIPLGSNTYTIQSNMSNHYVLDDSAHSTDNGTGILIWASNGGTNQQWVLEQQSTPVGKQQITAHNTNTQYFTLAPNPATNTIKIQPNSINNVNSLEVINNIKLYDQAGNLKMNRSYSKVNKVVDVNVSNLQSGVYFIEIKSGQNTERQRLIIQK